MKTNAKKKKLLIFSYLTFASLLLLYSYTQVDLNLTLSSFGPYQALQRWLIQLGYFHRTMSANIFLGLLAGLFGLYLYTLKMAKQGLVQEKQLWWLIAVTSLFIFAYPAFSHDLFNYMFDARIVTEYGQYPYTFKALDFPLDPWIRFMRWTHRYYPYGPGWLLITLLPSGLGMGKFVLTLGLFKFMFLGFHLLNILLIKRIMQVINHKNIITSAIFFALNPLVLVESLISPHNEVMMLTLALAAIYFWLKKQTGFTALTLVLSVSIKYISVVLAPLLLLLKRNSHQLLFTGGYYLWLLLLVPFILQREPYSWYFVPLVALATLQENTITKIITLGISAGTLFRYYPFLLFGDYSEAAQAMQMWGMILLLSLFIFIGYWLWQKRAFT